MDGGDNDALILPVPPAPFALIVGAALHHVPAGELETAIRHMGLRPEAVAIDDSDLRDRIAGPMFRLTFGAVSVLAGPAAGAALDTADPEHPATSHLAASLPADWRSGGQCWIFIPEREAGAPASAEQPERLREFFKMMVLLIDLFDATHLFWSPARLWSDAPQFRAAIAEMLISGMPPVLHLVAFRRRGMGEAETVGTRGLAAFAGQELEGRIPPGWDMAEMVKRLARLALDIMLNGPVRAVQESRGLYPGECVTLSPQGAAGDRSVVLVVFSRDG